HAVTGNQTTTVSGNRTVNVKGTETENFNALETNVKTDQKTSVGGNQTTIVTGNQTNNVSGNKTETVKSSVTEKYGSQETTVDGDQSTHVGGSQSNVVTGNQTNTISGSKTETVKGAVSETYGSQTTKVNGDQSTTVTGKQTNSITGDQVNTIGGSQTTTVTSDSSLSAKNITNTASEKITNQIGDGSAVKSEMTADGITNTAEGGTIYNKSKDILNEASGDILNFADGEIGNVATKITNITGDNTVTSDTNGTTFENKAHNTAIKEGTVTKTTISGNTIETGQAKMDYAEVMKDLGVHGNATVDQKLTVKGDSDLQGNANVGKNLTVNGTSDLKGNVTMESNATVQKDLTVNGTTTTNKLVVNNGATIKGGTTTDTLHVTSTSTFDGTATFKDIVTMEKDLSVSGNATVAGSMTASSYKVGDKTYISESGINANDQKVVNVAPGRIAADSKDAVNGSQLYQTNERVTSVENRVGTVENRVDKLDSRVDKVGANAAALANLHPLEFDADSKWNIAAAVGGYKGETATAIGAFYRPNENVMVNVSSSFGTGENMYGGGISLRIGQGGNKARRNATNGLTEREKAMQKQIDSLTSRLDALLSVINPNMSKDFPDVPENHWAYEAVSRLAGNGVIQGYEDGKYHGDRTMTRYEMAEIIYNALSKGAKAEKKLVEEFKPELQAMAAQKKA
ncbi:MAG: YadA-like family protein, partial [Megasphaera elsdenii]|nr:YadA-like family protein [Megasphaera elsdenii]